MNVEKIGYVLSAMLIGDNENNLTLQQINEIRLRCTKVIANADKEDLKWMLCANSKLALKLGKEFDEINAIFTKLEND